MSAINIAIGPVDGYNRPGSGRVGVLRIRATETLASGATSAQSTVQGQANGIYPEYAQITADGGDVYVAIGQNPTAEAGNASGLSVLIKDGTTRDFAIGPGEIVAVIDKA